MPFATGFMVPPPAATLVVSAEASLRTVHDGATPSTTSSSPIDFEEVGPEAADEIVNCTVNVPRCIDAPLGLGSEAVQDVGEAMPADVPAQRGSGRKLLYSRLQEARTERQRERQSLRKATAGRKDEMHDLQSRICKMREWRDSVCRVSRPESEERPEQLHAQLSGLFLIEDAAPACIEHPERLHTQLPELSLPEEAIATSIEYADSSETCSATQSLRCSSFGDSGDVAHVQHPGQYAGLMEVHEPVEVEHLRQHIREHLRRKLHPDEIDSQLQDQEGPLSCDVLLQASSTTEEGETGGEEGEESEPAVSDSNGCTVEAPLQVASSLASEDEGALSDREYLTNIFSSESESGDGEPYERSDSCACIDDEPSTNDRIVTLAMGQYECAAEEHLDQDEVDANADVGGCSIGMDSLFEHTDTEQLQQTRLETSLLLTGDAEAIDEDHQVHTELSLDGHSIGMDSLFEHPDTEMLQQPNLDASLLSSGDVEALDEDHQDQVVDSELELAEALHDEHQIFDSDSELAEARNDDHNRLDSDVELAEVKQRDRHGLESASEFAREQQDEAGDGDLQSGPRDSIFDRLHAEHASKLEKKLIQRRKNEQKQEDEFQELQSKLVKKARRSPSVTKDPIWEKLHAAAPEKERRRTEEVKKKQLEEIQYLESHSVHRHSEEPQGAPAADEETVWAKLFSKAPEKARKLSSERKRREEEEVAYLEKNSVHRHLEEAPKARDSLRFQRLHKEHQAKLKRIAQQRQAVDQDLMGGSIHANVAKSADVGKQVSHRLYEAGAAREERLERRRSARMEEISNRMGPRRHSISGPSRTELLYKNAEKKRQELLAQQKKQLEEEQANAVASRSKKKLVQGRTGSNRLYQDAIRRDKERQELRRKADEEERERLEQENLHIVAQKKASLCQKRTEVTEVFDRLSRPRQPAAVGPEHQQVHTDETKRNRARSPSAERNSVRSPSSHVRSLQQACGVQNELERTVVAFSARIELAGRAPLRPAWQVGKVTELSNLSHPVCLSDFAPEIDGLKQQTDVFENDLDIWQDEDVERSEAEKESGDNAENNIDVATCVDIGILETTKDGCESTLAGLRSLLSNCEIFEWRRDLHPLLPTSLRPIVDVLRQGDLLRRLTLNGMGLGVDEGSMLAEALLQNASLEHLELSSNDLGAEGGRAFAKVLAMNTTVKHLDLQSNNLGLECGHALAEPLKNNSGLRCLNLSMNSLGSSGALAFSHALKHNLALEDLHFSDNDIQDDGAVLLADSLSTNSGLVTLNIGGNGIQRKGARAIAQALKDNVALRRLFLSGNDLGVEGSQAFGKALADNCNLQHLDLCGNIIDVDGCLSLADALRKNRVLRRLDLCVNGIHAQGAQALAEALVDNCTLEHLEIGWNRIGDDGASAFAKALAKNSTLQHLNMVGNHFGGAGVEALIACFEENQSLHHLQVDGNDLALDSVAVIEQHLQLNRIPTQVLTLHPTLWNLDESDLELSCISVGGSELASVQISLEEDTLGKIRKELANKLDLPTKKLELLLAGGNLLSQSDDSVRFIELLGSHGKETVKQVHAPDFDDSDNSEDESY